MRRRPIQRYEPRATQITRDPRVVRESLQEQNLYDTLGPKARAVIAGAHRVLAINKLLSAYLTTGRRLDADGCPLAPDLQGADDERFAAFIERNAVIADCGKPVADLILKRRRRDAL